MRAERSGLRKAIGGKAHGQKAPEAHTVVPDVPDSAGVTEVQASKRPPDRNAVLAKLQDAFDQLSEREEQYRAVFEAATDGIVVLDGDSSLIVAVNPAYCRMHGYETMIGMAPNQYIHPDSLHLFPQFRDDLISGNHFRRRAQHVHRDGTAFDVDVIGRGFVFQGKFALLGVVRDVTEEVRAIQLLEERVRDRTREIERRRAVAEGMRDLMTVVNSGRSLDEILGVVVEQARILLESNASWILLPDPSEQVLIARAESGYGLRDVEELHLPIENTVVGLAYSQRRPVCVSDLPTLYAAAANDTKSQLLTEDHASHLAVITLPARSDAELASRIQRFSAGYRGFLSVPLASSERSHGVLNLNFHEPHAFTEEQIALAVAFADQVTLAIENARLSERVQAAAALEERQRLARDLHDAVTQTLFSTSLIAEVIPDLWETEPDLARQRLGDLRRLTRGALAEMRTLLLELRPGALTELTLGELLRQLSQATAGKTELQVKVDVGPQSASRLPNDVQVALYRIAQEAVNNVVRHAQASEVSVRLDHSFGGVLLEVRDDGCGFDPTQVPGGHLGVGIMHERARAIGADLRLQSAPGRGTSLEVVWSSPGGVENG